MSQAATVATNRMTWADLGSKNMEAAKLFYSQLFGWTPVEQPGEEMQGYAVFELDGKPVCGVMNLGDNPAPVNWLSYISVSDAREATARAQKAGAQVIVEPMDVMTNGAFSVIMDPAGSPIGLWEPRDVSGWQAYRMPKSVCWQELHSTDVDKAKKFYADVFGWELDSPEQFGGYTVCKLPGEAEGFAGITSTEHAPMRDWLTYIAVEDCDAMAGRVKEVGGTLLLEPQDIPGIGRFAVLKDTEGAELGLLQPAPQM